MEIKGLIKSFIDSADKLLYPHNLTCNLCGKEIFDGADFCDECMDKLHFNDHIFCENCGRKTNIPTKRCYSCNEEWAVDLARSVFLYDDGAESLIKAIKYGGKKYLTEVIAPYLKTIYLKNLFAPDYITYVPMTAKKQRKRGFNQSELLAASLCEIIDNRPIDLLIKTRETAEQKELTAEERKENLTRCFKVKDKTLVKDKKVLVIDDVLTTGATAHAVATALKKGGAKSVYLLTVASVQKDFI